MAELKLLPPDAESTIIAKVTKDLESVEIKPVVMDLSTYADYLKSVDSGAFDLDIY